MKFLLDQGVDPNVMNLFGATALMSAAAADDMDSVRLLLDGGADVNLRPDPGTKEFFWGGFRTPLMWAAAANRVSSIAALIKRGADIEAETAALRELIASHYELAQLATACQP